MSSKTFFRTPGKFCGMCGVVGIKDSPIIITYYFLFVNKRRKRCGLQGSGSPRRAFSFIITYFNKKIKFNLYATTAIEFAEKGFHMKNVLGLRCDILGNGNLNC